MIMIYDDQCSVKILNLSDYYSFELKRKKIMFRRKHGVT
jgi:hypothetical protein